jgi:hypothetical protein
LRLARIIRQRQIVFCKEQVLLTGKNGAEAGQAVGGPGTADRRNASKKMRSG